MKLIITNILRATPELLSVDERREAPPEFAAPSNAVGIRKPYMSENLSRPFCTAPSNSGIAKVMRRCRPCGGADLSGHS